MRQEDLAELAGVNQSTISRIECGLQTDVTAPVARALAAALQVNVWWLLDNAGEMEMPGAGPQINELLQTARKMDPEQLNDLLKLVKTLTR